MDSGHALSPARRYATSTARQDLDVIPRKEFIEEFGNDYVPGQHVSFFGPTGRGKSTLCFQLLGRVVSPDMRVTSLHGKIGGRDPVIPRAARHCGLRVVSELPGKYRTRWDRKHGKARNGYMLVPLASPGNPSEENEKLESEFRRALERNYRSRDKTITHINESHQVQQELRLRELCEAPLMRGGPDNAEWNEAQRGRYLSYHTYSAPEHLFVFYDDDRDNRKRYSDFGCADPDEVMWHTSHLQTARSLDGRTISQCLYIRRGGGMYIVDT